MKKWKLENIFWLIIFFFVKIFFQKYFKWKYFFLNYFWRNIFFGNIFDEIFFSHTYFRFFFVKIFLMKIFWWKYFCNNILLGKGFDFPSHTLLSTPNIQLPHPLTSYLKLRGGDKRRTNELTDRTDAMIVPFIVLAGYLNTVNRHEIGRLMQRSWDGRFG